MNRYIVAGLASLALTGCFPIGSCPDDTEPEPLTSGVYEAYQSGMTEDVSRILGGVEGAMEVTVDRVTARVLVRRIGSVAPVPPDDLLEATHPLGGVDEVGQRASERRLVPSSGVVA